MQITIKIQAKIQLLRKYESSLSHFNFNVFHVIAEQGVI